MTKLQRSITVAFATLLLTTTSAVHAQNLPPAPNAAIPPGAPPPTLYQGEPLPPGMYDPNQPIDPALLLDRLGFGLINLLGHPLVPPVIRLTPDQQRQMADLVAQVKADIATIQKGMQSLPEDQRKNINMADVKKRLGPVIQQYRRKVDEILTPAQSQRLREISLQVRGLSAVVDPEIADALKLNDEQRQKITVLVDEHTQRRQALTQAPRPLNKFERRDRRMAKRAMNQEFEQRVVTWLTPAQLDQFAAMQGPKLGLADMFELRDADPNSALPPRAKPENLDEPATNLGDEAPAAKVAPPAKPVPPATPETPTKPATPPKP